MTESLSARLREATRTMHRLAERSPFMGALIQGRLERGAYALFLRNLHALNASLEAAIDRHAASACLSPLHLAPLHRSAALADDLRHFQGPGWEGLPLLPAIRAYVAHLDTLADGPSHRLVAHAYVRYLGDLSGGQLLAKAVAKAYALEGAEGTAAYRFGDGADAEVLKEQFRAGIDAIIAEPQLTAEIVAEAVTAFERHVVFFQELQAVRQPPV